MEEDIIKLVNSFVYKRFTDENSCKIFFKDSMLSREDLRNDLLLYVYEKLPNYNKEKGTLSTYIYVLCKTKCYLIHRKNKRKEFNISLDSYVMKNENDVTYLECIPSDDKIIDMIIQQDILDRVKDELNNETKDYYLNDISQKEIAKKLNTSQANVSRKIRKNIKSLRHLF